MEGESSRHKPRPNHGVAAARKQTNSLFASKSEQPVQSKAVFLHFQVPLACPGSATVWVGSILVLEIGSYVKISSFLIGKN